MFIIKCDRCGKEKIVNNLFLKYPMFGSHEETNKDVPTYTISTIEDNEMKFIHLCKDCEEEFEKFLTGAKVYGPLSFEESEHFRGV